MPHRGAQWHPPISHVHREWVRMRMRKTQTDRYSSVNGWMAVMAFARRRLSDSDGLPARRDEWEAFPLIRGCQARVGKRAGSLGDCRKIASSLVLELSHETGTYRYVNLS